MARKITILIADRNPNVREFLKREMVSESYRVICAEDAKTVLKDVKEPFMVDVLIIDPDLPDMEAQEVLHQLHTLNPLLPVIVHCFPEENGLSTLPESSQFVEKRGRSIEAIKQLLKDRILERIT